MKDAKVGLGSLLACALLFSGCSLLNTREQSRPHTRPGVNLQTAVTLAVSALREYVDVDDCAGRYELEVKRHEDHWTLRFLFLPAGASSESCVLVYDTRKVVIIPDY